MFLPVSVILFTVGDLPHCMLGYTPPRWTKGRHPPLGVATPGNKHPPRADTPWNQAPLGADLRPPPPSRPLPD